MTAVRDDRVAYRHVPYGGGGGSESWIYLAEDWSAAAFELQVRADWGDRGTPMVSLVTSGAGSQGISASWEADFLDPETGENVGATIITPFIDQATLEAVAFPADPSVDLELVYDLHGTPTWAPKRVLVFGKFTLKPGSTI